MSASSGSIALASLMDLQSCCCSGGRSSSDTIHLGDHQPSYSSSSSTTSSGRSRKPVKWRPGIWMRLLKEKRGNADQTQVPSYNSYTYSQNFDQGIARDEPENISRSFSVRFADPALSSIVLRLEEEREDDDLHH